MSEVEITQPNSAGTVFVVSNVNTVDGEVPAVFAAHPTIANNMIELLACLEAAFGPETWDMEPDLLEEIGIAYTAYKQSPQQIVNEASEIVDAEIVD